MRILYIIGNGFDMNIGLETSYNQFYKYYEKVSSEKESVLHLKRDISNKFETWADLELALGEYTQNLKSVAELDEVLSDIGQHLSVYLRLEEEKLEKYQFDRNRFFEYLCFPERSFLPTDQERIEELKSKWKSQQWNLNIYTFNYTSVIEKILGEKQNDVFLAYHYSTLPVHLGEIKHIHGFLDEDMVIGVNDILQIKNEPFRENQDVLESVVKSECNKANRNKIDHLFTQRISAANLIVIFGSSLGETDNKWWQLIGERLKSDCFLIIFAKDETILPRMRHLQLRKEREIKNAFLRKTNLKENEVEPIREKIFIGYNSGFFDGIVVNKE